MTVHAVSGDRAVVPARRRWLSPTQLTGSPRRLSWRLALAELSGIALVLGLLLPPGPAVVLTLTWWLLLSATGCYASRLFPVGLAGLRAVCQVALVMVALTEVAAATVWPDRRIPMLVCVVLALGWLIACRVVEWAHWHVRRLRGAHVGRTVVVVGSRPAIERWMAEVASGGGQELVVVAACVVGRHGVGDEIPTVFGIDRVTEAVAAYGADAVLVVPCRQMPPAEIRRLAWRLEPGATELLIAPGLPDMVPRRATLGLAGSVSVLHVRPAELTGMRRLVKDVGERAVAGLTLMALAPVLLVLLILIRLDSPGRAVYRQSRIGRGGEPFTMYKLRTMIDEADHRKEQLSADNETDGVLFKIRSDPRVTRVGRVLRKYSLDEIPQLWNVVRGDMALVGPRPALPEEVAQYGDDMHRRMVVKPGLTGLWQVSGRSDLPWSRAVRLDLYYVDNWSLGLDIAIMLRTVHAVLAHSGAY
jgi:exopolysaccharide biosynthesis polyprenyl glycosylphosphotransferase